MSHLSFIEEIRQKLHRVRTTQEQQKGQPAVVEIGVRSLPYYADILILARMRLPQGYHFIVYELCDLYTYLHAYTSAKHQGRKSLMMVSYGLHQPVET